MSTENHFLDVFFYPRTVAIVGASANPRTRNFYLLSNLLKLGFTGKAYPVNPNASEVFGLKSYPSVASIEGEVDLAVIAVPAAKTLDVVRDCVAKRVKALTMVAGGFSETGGAGKELQEGIAALLRHSGIRATGPNALSPINTRNRFIIAFNGVDQLPAGGVSFVFQSGIYDPMLNWLTGSQNLRLAKLLDLGNKMDVNETDALEYLAQDADTRVIAMHMESIAGDARKFLRILKEVAPRKPVLILKSGRTPAGAKAAASHTGAIIRMSDAVFDAALRQAGAIRVQATDEFFDLAKAFEFLPPSQGNRVALCTTSGGEGVITTDLCQFGGLALAQVGAATRDRLSAIFPPWDMPVNPFDMGPPSQFHPDVEVHSFFIRAMLDDPGVDGIALNVILARLLESPDVAGDVARLLEAARQARQAGKPLTIWTNDPRVGPEVVRKLEAEGVPVYPSAERCIRALAALYRYGRIQAAAGPDA